MIFKNFQTYNIIVFNKIVLNGVDVVCICGIGFSGKKKFESL